MVVFVQVRLTIERLKAGQDEALRERDELHLRDMNSLTEQKDKGKF